MSVEKIAMGINLRKNKNEKSPAYGKYYPEVDQKKTLSLRGFAEHMVNHGSFYNRSIVEGVLQQICDCLPELVAQGVPVQLGSLGTFYPTAEVAKDGAVASIAEMDGLTPNDIVKAIHIRFLPDATKLDNLCGPSFKNACSLELRNIVDTQEVTIDGKVRKVQTLKPIATAVAEWRSGQTTNGGTTDPDNGGGGSLTPDPSPEGEGSNDGGGNAGGSFTIAASVSGEGGTVTIKKNGVAVEGGSVEATGSDTVVIEAVPENENFQFMGWSDGVNANPRTIQPSADMNVTANFLDLSKI